MVGQKTVRENVGQKAVREKEGRRQSGKKMNRKAIRIGKSSLVVSIPAGWARANNVKKGSEIELETIGSELRVHTKATPTKKSCTIEVSDLYPLIQKVAGVAYKTGYTRMKFIFDPKASYEYKFKKRKQIDLIKFAVDPFVGVDIVEIKAGKTGDYALALERADVEREELESTANQLFLNILNQARQISEAMEKSERDLTENINASEVIINQTSDFCLKVISTKGLENHRDEKHYYDIYNRLEMIGDAYHFLYQHFVKSNKKPSAHTIDLLNLTIANFHLYYSIYLKFDRAKLLKLANENFKGINTSLEMISSHPDQAAYLSEIRHIFFEIDGLFDAMISLNIEKITRPD